MGHGSRWTSAERRAIAIAYREATGDPVIGANQDAQAFRNKIIERMKTSSPDPCPDGRCWKRGTETACNYWRDNIAKDLGKFISRHRQIMAQDPTGGLSRQELTNCAVAKHLGKTRVHSPAHRNFDANCWKNYGAWCEVNTLPKFSVDVIPTGHESSSEEEEEEDEDEFGRHDDSDGGDEEASVRVGRAGGGDNSESGGRGRGDGNEGHEGGDGGTVRDENRRGDENIPSAANRAERTSGHERRRKSTGGQGRGILRCLHEQQAREASRAINFSKLVSLSSERLKQQEEHNRLAALKLGIASNLGVDDEKVRTHRQEIDSIIAEQTKRREEEETRRMQQEEQNNRREENDGRSTGGDA